MDDWEDEPHPNTPGTSKRARQKQKRKWSGLQGPDPELLEQRKQLPIWKEVPQFLHEAGLFSHGMIAVTQPRRIAATSLAARVSAEQRAPLGTLVGYSVRFDEKASENTKVKYMTDGMIVRELLNDPLLERYSVIVVDEAHERTLRTDMLLASLKSIQKRRNTKGRAKQTGGEVGKISEGKHNPLKVVIMSATLDAERFSKFFGGAKILFVQGRQHPVKIYYTEEPQPDYVESALQTLFQIHTQKETGDILIFLSGQEEIESLEHSINLYASQLSPTSPSILVCPMYAALSPHQQSLAFRPTPPNTRKCVIATNIAETSITIPGIRYVIDSGVSKEKSYQVPAKGFGIDTLVIKPISKSSAQQRTGRAGREGPGYCFRLYTEQAFRGFRSSSIPEIQRCNLTSAVLDMKCLGQNPETADFLDAPDPEKIGASLVTLFGLEALDQKGDVTPLGRQMSNFPLDPPLSRALLASKSHGCTAEIVSLLSLLSSSSKLFFDPASANSKAAAESLEARAKFRHPSGDHLTMFNALRAYEEITQIEDKRGAREWCNRHFLNERTLKEAGNIARQLRSACDRVEGMDRKVSCGDDEDAILKSLLLGFFQNTAMIQPDGTYRQTLGQKAVKIHPSSTMFGRKVPAIMYSELLQPISTINPSDTAEIIRNELDKKCDYFERARNLIVDAAVALTQAQLSSIRTRRNEFSPSNRLPDGILSHIFTVANDDWATIWGTPKRHRVGVPLVISSVSKRWRAIALDTPRLWAAFDATSSRYVHTFLARSKQAPLKIELVLAPPVWSTYDHFWDHFQPSMDTPSSLLLPFIPHADRWQSLRIHTKRQEDIERLTWSSLPHLETLHISVLKASLGFTAIHDVFAGERPPRLRSLTLERFSLPLTSPAFLSLTSLGLAGIRYPAGSIHQFLRILLPTLERLTLGDVAFSVPHNYDILRSSAPPAPDIVLPRLQTLTISDLEPNAQKYIFASVVFSPLLRLAISETRIGLFPPHYDITLRLPSLLCVRSLRITFAPTKAAFHIAGYGLDTNLSELSAII
ncbi:hypothetical protein BOTBODRAFT_49315 [Botryobasidium botryosum FD-172 SS1]|uniref:RNA helicase n=1 Tax=Botryobasidium botryosum (strain FD-172 SS1) TaxID=930990 RepID=A0A067LU13_BOTB1|nr:hypothetical protein BOTBODRAFT_49315 [Botryobasidium botryosum FD-172 SS1]